MNNDAGLSFQTLAFRISPVQLSDSGIYTCVAQSQAGLAELSYNLLVQGMFLAIFGANI